MHIYVLMLHIKFELIPIKIGFFTIFKSCSKIGCTIVQGILSKMARREFSILIIFSDAYTCSYVAYQV